MSGFLQRWQELARASQALPQAPLPPVPLRHWPVRIATRRAARSPGERRGLVLSALALAATWVIAVLLWPAVTASAPATTTAAGSNAPGLATDAGPSGPTLPRVAHLSQVLPALPHPAAPARLFAQAYVALTTSDPSQEPHL